VGGTKSPADDGAGDAVPTLGEAMDTVVSWFSLFVVRLSVYLQLGSKWIRMMATDNCCCGCSGIVDVIDDDADDSDDGGGSNAVSDCLTTYGG
jgi:hypothetical protein